MRKLRYVLLFACIGFSFSNILQAQPDRWQQRAEYSMDIVMDTKKHQYTGTQKLVYYNNSPDELDKIFYHLYFNAFQPGSMMDVRSRTIEDPDDRVGDRISRLSKDEEGYMHIKTLTIDGKPVKKMEEVGTILEVALEKPIAPNSKVVLEMEFEGQVPMQIRRSGRDSKEGIDYSMTQWYPKLCEYDYQGWHANPYIGREFYGVWGDFDVKITMPKEYILGGTGVVQNPNEVGHGYEDVGLRVEQADMLTWHFRAENVHDFAWAADRDYTHDVIDVNDSLVVHFLYESEDAIRPIWQKVQPYTKRAFKFIQKRYGTYPYPCYTIIQGGDGGMEYPMATLITGERQFGSLLGVIVHEVMHTWYQMLMGTNESLYSWMDEGFTTYSSNVVMAYLFNQRDINEQFSTYKGYMHRAKEGNEEALTTHADHFGTNGAYGNAAYSKGAVFLGQLHYIIGKEAFDKGMLEYYNQWRFKHPNPNDFIRVMERVSGLELDWYKEYFVNTTHFVDYNLKEVASDKKETVVTLERVGEMPMPIEVMVRYKDGKEMRDNIYYIPLVIMRGEKKDEGLYGFRKLMPDWAWVNYTYELRIPIKLKDIEKIVIDPSERLADVNRDNNNYEK